MAIDSEITSLPKPNSMLIGVRKIPNPPRIPNPIAPISPAIMSTKYA